MSENPDAYKFLMITSNVISKNLNTNKEITEKNLISVNPESEGYKIEYDNILIAPSKGNISREIDPSTVNYFFEDIYTLNNNYPNNAVSLREPYVLRDFRGQTITFKPFSYNPIQKKLILV